MRSDSDVAWVGDLAQYVGAAGLGDDAPPVIRPRDEDRARRWEEVLRWYRGLAGRAPLASTGESAAGWREILVVGRDLLPIAEVHAAATGARLSVVSATGQAVQEVLSAFDLPVTIIAPPSFFSGAMLRMVPRSGQATASVLTAQDAPGLTFLLAKMRYAEALSIGPVGAVDHLVGQWCELGVDGRAGHAGPLDDGVVGDAVLGRDWHGLALVAHGEGGHLNLGRLVLCGLLGDRERTKDGRALDGCHVDGGTLRCKRAPRDTSSSASFTAIHAVHLAIFSCATAAVSYEPFPSSVSGVLSALDGYACSVITPDRLVDVEPDDARFALGACYDDWGPAAITAALNEVHMRRRGARPFVLFGWPGKDGGAAPHGQRDGAVRTTGQAVAVAATVAGARVVALQPVCRDLALLAGDEHVFLVARESGLTPAGEVVDATPRWERGRRAIAGVAERAGRLQPLERAISRWSVGHGDRPGSDDLRRLRVIRLGLEHALEAATVRLEHCRELGIWEPDVDAWLGECASRVGDWDRAFADVLRGELAGSLAELLLDAHVTQRRVAVEACDTCGFPQSETTATPALGSATPRRQVDCSGCGVREIGRVGEGRIEVRTLPLLTRGSEASIRVGLSDLDGSVPNELPSGRLVCHVRDVTHRAPFFVTVVAPVGDECEVRFPVPADLAPDLHPLRVCWVRALEVTLLRRRIPALPGCGGP